MRLHPLPDPRAVRHPLCAPGHVAGGPGRKCPQPDRGGRLHARQLDLVPAVGPRDGREGRGMAAASGVPTPCRVAQVSASGSRTPKRSLVCTA